MGAVPHSTEPRWRRLPEERPRQILTAALEVFGERGLAAARLDDIAKRAGVSKGTIYLYFPNKEELFREMVRYLVVSNLEESERSVNASSASATATLTEFMRKYWERIRGPQFGPLFRLIHAEIHNFPDLASFYGQEVVARSQRLIAGILQRGIDRGEFRPIDPFVAARMLSAPFVMHGLWCSHRDCFADVARKSDEQILQEMIDFYLYAIRPSSPDAARSTSK
jgi:AcrR family transcriptional regulator